MKKILYNKATLKCVSKGCPTSYEFEDVTGDNYYFRLRHGYWYLENENEDEILIEGKANILGLDGVCSWEQAIQLMELKNVQLMEG